jgi:hypothetical protein
MASKAEFARKWYELGVCPGCGAALEDVAGVGARHYRGRDKVSRAGGPVVTYAGEGSGTNVSPSDVRLCVWSADDLTSLVLIGSGMVYGGGRGNARAPRDSPAPVIAPAIGRGPGNQ